jgi:predicted dienelactone hydrolase
MKPTVAFLLALSLALTGLAARAGAVGFQQLTIPNGDDRPLTIGVWYPTDAATSPQPLGGFVQDVAPNAAASGERLPLVVFSHGTGGWYGEHVDTALALAHAGFVVAAVSHPGDTYDDASRRLQIWLRPQQLKTLVDYMLGGWSERGRIDPNRIGAFGFSAGGFATLVAIGGTPDLTQVSAHCERAPTSFECGLATPQARAAIERTLPQPSAYAHDGRIKAAVVAAPALGYTFGKAGLSGVTIPVQLWRAEDDHLLPNPDYAQKVRDDLPQPAEYHVVANADHFDFLAPCTPALAASAPEICVERPGFDRAAFHASFDAEVVRFFRETLR